MITAETKDWTWVLDRPCPDCGFDPNACEVTVLAVRDHLWDVTKSDV